MRRSLLAAFLAAFLAAGCAHAAAPAPPSSQPAGPARPAPASAPSPASAPPAPVDPGLPSAPSSATAAAPQGDGLDGLRAQVDGLLAAQGELAWRAWTVGEPVDAAGAWKGREQLLSPETLSQVAAAASSAPGARRLHAFLVGERIARATASQAQALAAARGAATLTWDKRSVPLRQVQPLLAAEAAAPRRQALASAHAAATARLLPLVAARDAAVAAEAHRLGFASTLDLAALLRGEPVEALAALAEATLARTEATWRALLEALARRELATPLERVRERDVPRLLRTTAPADAFPAGGQLAEAEALLAGLGLDLSAGGRLTLDGAARPGKLPRPVTIPVEAPAGVRLSLAPVAGLEAARGLLHELGVAQAAARVTAAPVEDRRLGPAALPEAWGRLLASVASAPEWLSAHGLAPEAVQREARVTAARRLHAARQAAARVLAEVARARDPGAAAPTGAALMRRASGHPLDAGEPLPWALEPDPLLRAADALQAELLAAQVERHLTRAAGGPWWRARASGAWLAAAWAQGSRRSPADLARAMGTDGLDPVALDEVARAGALAGGVEIGGR